VDLGRAVAGMRDLLERTLGGAIELDLEVPDRSATVTIDVHQFEQVLLNLALNARHAMPDGGRLEIALTRRDDGWVELVVADTGSGMEPAVAERAFDPFFTTKPAGEGSGLGLAAVYGIVTEAGGHVGLESALGEGTRVLVELPESGEPEGAAAAAPALDAPPARGRTILLVEDEAAVRSMAARIRRRHGYGVVEAAGGEEALATFRGLEPAPDLVLTDVAMPRMSGVELAARLGRSSPPVVFMSGYTDASVDRPEVLAHSAGFLQKPFSAAALLHRVGEALAGGAERAV
jgi:CheY-like chemotaxis protein